MQMIIVTGASKGLGAAIANRLIEQGKEVYGLARNTNSLNFQCANCDVSSYGSVKSIAKSLRKNEVKIEAVINAAGVASMNLAVTANEATTQVLLQTNLAGTIYCCQLFAPLMIRNRQGSFINFSTIAVKLGLKGESILHSNQSWS